MIRPAAPVVTENASDLSARSPVATRLRRPAWITGVAAVKQLFLSQLPPGSAIGWPPERSIAWWLGFAESPTGNFRQPAVLQSSQSEI
mgnify:FL=1